MNQRLAPVEPHGTEPTAAEHALTAAWQRALAGDAVVCSQWHTVEGDGWHWQADGAVVRPGTGDWTAMNWQGSPDPALRVLRNFVIEITVTGSARAAGISFGPYKDFLTTLEPGHTRRLQLEVDADAGCWTFRVDGQLMPRCWWDANLKRIDDLLNGVFTLKAHCAEQVRFHDLTLSTFQSSCQLSVIIVCHLFLQRLRITLRNWCYQNLPTGAYEVLVVNPGSPDGTHEHLAAVARSFPHVRVREIPAAPAMATNKGMLINYGLRASRGAWIWLTDADCLFGPDSAATALTYIRQREPQLFYAERRHLCTAQTDALLAGRLDGLHDFATLAQMEQPHHVDCSPWGYTQIVPRHVLERIPYPNQIAGFARSDLHFSEACTRLGIRPERIPGLFCLHLDHPFAWNGAAHFL